MEAHQAADLFAALRERGFQIWVAGGWAVDALVGHETRQHQDLDLAVDAEQLEEVLQWLAACNFEVQTDWLPSRVELVSKDGRRVDIHPVQFRADGSGLQEGWQSGPFHYASDGFSRGRISGQLVDCLGATQQLTFREGFVLSDKDHHDIALMRAFEGI